MFFFCKPKTIILDAFTTQKILVDALPPVYASKVKPNWWKEMKPPIQVLRSGIQTKVASIKGCQGFKDYYSELSIIVPFWNSMILEYNRDGSRFSFSNGHEGIEYQNEGLRGNKYLNDFHHFKLTSPWKLKEKTGVNFLFSQPFYNFDNHVNMTIPPAILNFKHQHALNANLFFKKPENDKTERFEMYAGQPLIYLTPLTEKRIIIKTHQVSEKEIENLFLHPIFFTNIYNKVKKLKDKN